MKNPGLLFKLYCDKKQINIEHVVTGVQGRIKQMKETCNLSCGDSTMRCAVWCEETNYLIYFQQPNHRSALAVSKNHQTQHSDNSGTAGSNSV